MLTAYLRYSPPQVSRVDNGYSIYNGLVMIIVCITLCPPLSLRITNTLFDPSVIEPTLKLENPELKVVAFINYC